MDSPDSLAPVLVWLHGGGFSRGSALSAAPARLAATQRLVVVTIQYRLGALGFILPGGTDTPTNLGLRDQAAAVHWVTQGSEIKSVGSAD